MLIHSILFHLVVQTELSLLYHLHLSTNYRNAALWDCGAYKPSKKKKKTLTTCSHTKIWVPAAMLEQHRWYAEIVHYWL